jgi:hypothetical protein
VGPDTAVLFVTAGVRLHRASYDSSAGNMPEFYRRRMSMNPNSPGMSTTFADPALVVGVG